MRQAIDNLGHFDDAAREFVLTTPRPPRFWRNILWNARYNTQPCQTGAGICYRRDPDGEIVLLNWSGQKAFYLGDPGDGAWLSVGNHPVWRADCTDFSCRYGLGYHIIEQRHGTLALELAVTVDPERCVEYYRLVVRNTSPKSRSLVLVPFFDVDLNLRDPYFGTVNRWRPELRDDGATLFLANVSHLAGRAWNAFLSADRPFFRYTFDREQFVGCYGNLAAPDALGGAGAGTMALPEMPALAGHLPVHVPAGEERHVFLAFGNIPEDEDGGGRRNPAAATHFQAALNATSSACRARLNKLQIDTPDPEFNRYVNTWLQHQLAYCADWNRGWGRGFRDQLQDAAAVSLTDPAHARQLIAAALPHVFPDGRALRKWAPVDRNAYNDGAIWLALAVERCVATSGDRDFLLEPFGYFESDQTGTVLDHVLRGLRYLDHHRGTHGCCLMPFGDWNDQLTGPGRGGRGESVWTTLGLAAALRATVPLAQAVGAGAEASFCQGALARTRAALQEHAWNGQWFTRAFTDDGRPVGHPDCAAGKIYLLPQAWSLIADIATGAQREAFIAACREHLLVDHGYLLLAPPYETYDPAIGHLSAKPPGFVENGSNYCHASSFMAFALAGIGELDAALDLFRRLLPTNSANPPSQSHQEPFSLTNTYRGPAAGPAAGRSLFSWRTGTAGWMLRTAVEGILGLRWQIDGLHLPDALPAGWDDVTVAWTGRGGKARIRIRRGNSPATVLDGRPLNEAVVPASAITADCDIQRTIC